MKFTSPNALNRFKECRQFAYDNNLANNFNEIFTHLMMWEKYDETGPVNEIYISSNFSERSFIFEERYRDGSTGIKGGIIFHGTPGQYKENGSVQMDPSYGWQVHT